MNLPECTQCPSMMSAGIEADLGVLHVFISGKYYGIYAALALYFLNRENLVPSRLLIDKGDNATSAM